jgi:maleate isomerase
MPDARFAPPQPSANGHPDSRSFRRRLGLLVPATNTIMEHELWSLIHSNGAGAGLDGVGLKTTPVITPKPDISTPEGVAEFRAGFIGGLEAAVQTALLARPQYMIMGLSLEHILFGLDSINETMESVTSLSDLSWATWNDAVKAALGLLGATRIGILTPWEASGNASAIRMFNDMGIDVVASVGLNCANLSHLAHLPDAAKEQAVVEVLATTNNRLDAVVQCGTGMSMLNVIDRLEERTGVPIVAINPTTLWYALRENGLDGPLLGAGRLLREF